MSDLPLPPARRKLGASTIEVSSLAWGMWRFVGHSDVEAARLVNGVRDAGITFFDTADIYGFDGKGGFGDAEVLFGKVLRAQKGLRDEIVIASKGGIRPPIPYNSSADYLAQAIESSLQRLAIDRLDLWQIHRPDILTHPQEIARALENAIKSGKIAQIGVSNFTLAQTAALAAFLPMPIVSSQPELSPLRILPFENGELDFAMQHKMSVLAWSPLGGGRLSDPKSKQEIAVAAALDEIAQAHSVSRAATAYAWLMAHPARVIPILGTQQIARLKDAGDAMKIKFSRDDWYRVFVAARGEPLP